jgi:hypothetical protein
MADMWHVVQNGQRQSTQLNAAGTGFSDVWEITFQVDSGPAQGTVGSVRIPQEFYTPEYVRSEIDKAVVALDAVAGL